MGKMATTAAAAVLAFGGALAFGPDPAAAQPQGFFGPGPDGDYQPPAYDRDRVEPGRGARRQGRADDAGLYSGPLYDREPYGYLYRGAGAAAVRPDRTEMERAGRAEFDRGYRIGREDERRRLRVHAARDRARGDGADRGGGLTDDAPGLLIPPLEHGLEQRRAMQDLRRSLGEARTAVQQGDRARAEAALAQADRLLRLAGPGVGGDRLAAALMNRAEHALERGDQEAARRALQQVRDALHGQDVAQQQRPADTSGGGSGAAEQTGR